MYLVQSHNDLHELTLPFDLSFLRQSSNKIVKDKYYASLIIWWHQHDEQNCFICRNLKDIHGKPYFIDYFDVYFRLYVLTTTANNPDVM